MSSDHLYDDVGDAASPEQQQPHQFDDDTQQQLQQQQQQQLHHENSQQSLSVSSSNASMASHPQLVALRKIDALSEKLQKEGKLLEALQCMEKSLILRGHIFGLDSIEVYRACKSVGEMCNYLAMTFLQQDLYDVALELLKKAEVLTERHRGVRAITFNNLACYYRKRGKHRTALNYCRKALGIESKLESNVKTADTHLNMCTILSELKRHDKAIVHARLALKLLLMELFGDFDVAQQQQLQHNLMTSSSTNSLAHTQSQAQLLVQENYAIGQTAPEDIAQLRSTLPPDRVAVLAIAYHNLAVQNEFLHKYNEALISYEKACKVVTTHLGNDHPLVASLNQSYLAAHKKIEAKQKKAGAQRTQKKPVTRIEKHLASSSSTKILNRVVSQAQIGGAGAGAGASFSDGEETLGNQHDGFTSDNEVTSHHASNRDFHAAKRDFYAGHQKY